MAFEMIDDHWQKSSFTADFSFSNGVAYFNGFSMPTVVSEGLGLKYRVLVQHPVEKNFWTMRGMENPMTQDKIQSVLEAIHNGSLRGKEFVFEVFDKTGKRELFSTKFNVAERIPEKGYGSDYFVVQSFSWQFDLPNDMWNDAKKALEEHFSRKVTI